MYSPKKSDIVNWPKFWPFRDAAEPTFLADSAHAVRLQCAADNAIIRERLPISKIKTDLGKVSRAIDVPNCIELHRKTASSFRLQLLFKTGQ